MNNKQLIKNRLIKQQNNKCYYCWCKFDDTLWGKPTLDHIIPKCKVWDNTKFVVACKKCNLYKGSISQELFEDWYICVNIKEKYDWQSYNEATKVRWPIKWYNKMFPKLFDRNKKKYCLTYKIYE